MRLYCKKIIVVWSNADRIVTGKNTSQQCWRVDHTSRIVWWVVSYKSWVVSCRVRLQYTFADRQLELSCRFAVWWRCCWYCCVVIVSKFGLTMVVVVAVQSVVGSVTFGGRCPGTFGGWCRRDLVYSLQFFLVGIDGLLVRKQAGCLVVVVLVKTVARSVRERRFNVAGERDG